MRLASLSCCEEAPRRPPLHIALALLPAPAVAQRVHPWAPRPCGLCPARAVQGREAIGCQRRRALCHRAAHGVHRAVGDLPRPARRGAPHGARPPCPAPPGLPRHARRRFVAAWEGTVRRWPTPPSHPLSPLSPLPSPGLSMRPPLLPRLAGAAHQNPRLPRVPFPRRPTPASPHRSSHCLPRCPRSMTPSCLATAPGGSTPLWPSTAPAPLCLMPMPRSLRPTTLAPTPPSGWP